MPLGRGAGTTRPYTGRPNSPPLRAPHQQNWQGTPSPGADVVRLGADSAVNAAESRCRCGRGEPSAVADVAGARPVLVQMWPGASPVLVQMWPGASPVLVEMWAGVGPVPVEMWQGGEPSPLADVAGVQALPVNMRKG